MLKKTTFAKSWLPALRPVARPVVTVWWGLYLATAVLLFATCAGFGGRLGWLPDLASHWRWQYAWGGAVLALLFLLGRRGKGVLLASLVLLVNGAQIWPLYTAVATPPAAQTLRAVSINVLQVNTQMDKVLAFLETADPDIIVLSEVTDAWEPALQELAAAYPYQERAFIKGYAATVLYSRYPFTDTDIILDVERPAVAAHLDIDGQPLTVIGAQPNSPVAPYKAALRNRQLDRLAAYVTAQTTPVLLLGDLNITPWSPHLTDFLAQTELRNGRIGFGVQATWPAAFGPLGIPIDHALVSADILVHHFATGPGVGSDHVPIIVDFSLRLSSTACCATVSS
ncbi:MAG: endonuclease/exonuclease/phosphatase family protein [Anaerolineales bacterium]|nr:endonuclease/exonuclease/phosphatase family protein [Anaerolineales bacterium]